MMLADQYKPEESGPLWDIFSGDAQANLKPTGGIFMQGPLLAEVGSKRIQAASCIYLDYECAAYVLRLYIPPGIDDEAAFGVFFKFYHSIAVHHLSVLLSNTFAAQVEGAFAADMHFASQGIDDGRPAYEFQLTNIQIYYDGQISDGLRNKLASFLIDRRHRFAIRDARYMKQFLESRKPKFFICHDSRDADTIAEPLAHRLRELVGPVWFDKFSLKPGSRIREALESGLKACDHCLLLVTPNFLENASWAREEFDTALNLELGRNEDRIVPVWIGVSREDVKRGAAMLLNRSAVASTEIETIARSLHRMYLEGQVK